MEFQIRFNHPGFDSAEVGLDALKRAREETGVPQLDARLVESHIPTRYAGRRAIVITETQAEDSGHFALRCTVSIQIKFKLDIYRLVSLHVNRDTSTGAVTNCKWDADIDIVRLMADWIAAGYPLTWTTGGDVQEDNE